MISLHTCLVVMIMAYPSLFSCSVISTLQLFSDLIGTRALWDNYWLDTSPPSNLRLCVFVMDTGWNQTEERASYYRLRDTYQKNSRWCWSSTESEYVTENELTDTSPSQVTTLEWRQQVGDEKTGAGGMPLHASSWTQGGTTQSNQQVIEDLETAVRKVQDEAARMVSQEGRTVSVLQSTQNRSGGACKAAP